MFDYFKKSIRQKEVDKGFREKIISENSRWAVILLILVAASQAIFVMIEAFGLLPWSMETLFFRIAVFFVAALLSAIMIVARNNEKVHKYLVFVMVMLNVIALLAGVFFTMFFPTEGNFSFTVFLLVIYILSVSYVFRPQTYIIIYFIVFAATVVHLSNNFNLNSLYIGEIISAGIFLLLIAAGSSLGYYRYKKVFLQEKRIEDINNRLELVTQTDELTGLSNRRKATEELEKQLALSTRYNFVFTVVMLDIDHFKHVNDTYGHNIGDDILREFSGLLESKLRTTDFIGRWGGEEFILILPNTNADASYRLLSRLQKELAGYEFETVKTVNFSAGICTYTEGRNINQMINCADKAMYQAKENGRNRIEVFREEEPAD